MYKVCPIDMDVKALAQRQFWYFGIHSERAELVSEDPTRRDRLVVEMNNSVPNSIDALVPYRVHADTHLDTVDAQLQKLTPESFSKSKSRQGLTNIVHTAVLIVRITLTFKAQCSSLLCCLGVHSVSWQYELQSALEDHLDLDMVVEERTEQL